MYTFMIDDEERLALLDLLECNLEDLHSEIVHTDNRELKDCLKDRKQLLLKIQASLKQLAPQ